MTERRNAERVAKEREAISLCLCIDDMITNLLAQEPYTIADFERNKMKPNYSLFDEWEDDDERWGE